ncbi:MAG: class II D-tagatose-bisphosphate aldolase non-catalytic subunit [Paracoccaceae bacterium]
MADVLRRIIARNRAGQRAAIPSVCSAHPDVLRASLMLAAELRQPIVIEATSNQVNQDGGYTGQRPANFIAAVRAMADETGLARDQVIFGGDHLGPQVWRKGPAEIAIAKARVMVADYVRAGFTKIHLDCSEGCAGEPAQVGDALAASRAADLAKAALTATDAPDALLFVVGTEVPPPGGARADDHGAITPTTAKAAAATMAAHHEAFLAAGLGHAVAQIGGLVVQPGVEFTPMDVHHLPLNSDPGLGAVLSQWPGLCLEAHSTDYQYPAAFARLATLGFAFQKVGPALTFAYRQAVYALDAIRLQAGWATSAPVWEVMDALMLANPVHWKAHYHAGAGDLRMQRHFGLADRMRYYWPDPSANHAVGQLLADLDGRGLAWPLLQQGFSPQVIGRAARIGGSQARALITAQIQQALLPYFIDSSSPIGEEPVP